MNFHLLASVGGYPYNMPIHKCDGVLQEVLVFPPIFRFVRDLFVDLFAICFAPPPPQVHNVHDQFQVFAPECCLQPKARSLPPSLSLSPPFSKARFLIRAVFVEASFPKAPCTGHEAYSRIPVGSLCHRRATNPRPPQRRPGGPIPPTLPRPNPPSRWVRIGEKSSLYHAHFWLLSQACWQLKTHGDLCKYFGDSFFLHFGSDDNLLLIFSGC